MLEKFFKVLKYSAVTVFNSLMEAAEEIDVFIESLEDASQ